MGAHPAIATPHGTAVRNGVTGAVTEIRRAAMIAARKGIEAMPRGVADQPAMVNERSLVVMPILAKAARITIRARRAKASIVKAARTTSAAIRARNNAIHGPRNRHCHDLLASR